MYRPMLVFLAGAILALPLAAQRPNLRHYTVRDGLPQAQVLSLTQDREGYLWFGTYAGVARYDGQRFQTISSTDGLPVNTVRQLLALDDGRIALRAASRDFCLLAPDKNEAIGYSIECFVLGPMGSKIVDMSATEESSLFVVGDGGVWRYENHGVEAVDTQTLPSQNAQAVAVASGWLWVGTDQGLVRRRADSPGDPFERLAPFAGANVRSLCATDKGMLVATADGVALWNGERLKWADLPARTLVDFPRLTVDGDGTVWLASTTGVIGWKGDEIVILNEERGLPGNIAHAVFADRESSLWIGTDFGVTKLVPGPFVTFGVAEGAPNSLVRAVAEDGAGRLWIGTRKGVARMVGEQFEPISLPQLTDRRIFSLAAEGDETMWIGSPSGLIRWRSRTERMFTARDGLPGHATMALIAEPGHGLWVGTSRGVGYLRNDVGQTVRHPDLEAVQVNSMTKRGPGEIWIGLQAGGVRVVRYKLTETGPEVESVEVLGESEGLTNFAVWSLHSDAHGDVWIGTNGDGAFRRDAAGNLHRVSTKTGLANDFVWQVLSDHEGYIWFYTSRGLNRLRDDEMSHFSYADGLPDLEGMATAVLQDREGDLWFGTSAGIVRFDRKQQVTNQVPPVVVIEGLRSRRLGRLEPGAVLPRDVGMLTVTFSALSFREESAVRFRYRLESGQPVPWSEPFGGRSLSFANLGPGSYRLQVEAANEAGKWSEQAAEITFEVLPAWWQSRLVLGGSVLALIGFAAAGLRWRTWHLEVEKERLEDLVSERAAELEKQNLSLEQQIEHNAKTETERQRLEERLRQSEKMQAVGRLAGGVAHDFNNLLTTIAGFGELLRDQLGEESSLRAEVDEILDAAERAARLTQQLLAFSRKQVVEPLLLPLNEVVEDISRMLRRLIGEDVSLNLGLNAQSDTVRCDRGQLEQILVNLAVNARDSMPGGGTLTLRTRNDLFLHPMFGHLGQEIDAGNYVAVEVEDTGTGMEPEIVEHIFEPFFTTKETGKGTGLGLATVYGIVRQNEGFIDVDTKPQRGTRFIVRLPVVNEQPAARQVSGALPIGRLGVQRHTVLIVEDEEAVRRLIVGILTKYGYRVLEADSGESAFAISRTHNGRIDLLLTDVVMPEKSGHLVAKQLSAERDNLKVLYVSGYPDDYLGQRGILPSGTNFLNKPFTPKKLILKVRQVLGEEPME